MHAFTSALAAALAVGSAMAVPMNAARHIQPEVPACSGVPTVTVTEILPFPSQPATVPSSSPEEFPVSSVLSAVPASSAGVSSVVGAPSLPTPPVGVPGAPGNVIVIIKQINIEIVEVENLINVDIELIRE